MTSSKCKTLKSKSKKKKTASTTSRTKWIKEVQHKLDGGTITSYDRLIGNRYRLHVWQMYGPGNKWNWIFEDKHYGEVGTRGDRIIMQSRYNETIETYREAIDEASKAFMWFLAVRLLRGDDHPTFILRGFEDV